MTQIKNLVDLIQDEICSAKDYAESYVEYKIKDNSTWAQRYKEMANDELKHATYLHEKAVMLIEDLSSKITPPQDMLDKWENSHKKFVEEIAWVKQMLLM